MATIDEQDRVETRPGFKKREHGRNLFKNKKAGDQIVIIPVEGKFWRVKQMTYPVLTSGDEGEQESIGFVRLSGQYWKHRAKAADDMQANFIKADTTERPMAESGLTELANFMLEKFRKTAAKLYVQTGKAKSEDEAKLRSVDLTLKIGEKDFWSTGSEEFGTLALVNGEPLPFPVKATTFDPVSNARHKGKYWREDATPDEKVSLLLNGGEFTPDDFEAEDLTTKQKLAALYGFNQGIKQIYEAVVEKGGKQYFQYPPFITEIILSARTSKNLAFGKSYIVWKPEPNLHPDYQQYLPVEYERPLAIHPADADAMRAYLAIPKGRRADIPVPAYRGYPDENGNLTYISRANPHLPALPVINLFEGSLGERFTPEMIQKLAEYGEYHGFKPNTQEGLVGGYFYDYPVYDFTIESVLAGKEVSFPAKTVARRIYVSPGVQFTVNDKNEPEVEVDGHKTTFHWSEGLLNAKPVNLDKSYLLRILLACGLANDIGKADKECEVVFEEIKAKAKTLGIPFVGGEKPAPYGFYKQHPDYQKLLAFYEKSSGKKKQEAQAEEADDVPVAMERGTDIGL